MDQGGSCTVRVRLTVCLLLAVACSVLGPELIAAIGPQPPGGHGGHGGHGAAPAAMKQPAAANTDATRWAVGVQAGGVATITISERPRDVANDETQCVMCPSCLRSFYDGCLLPAHKIRKHKDCVQYGKGHGPLCDKFVWECPRAGVWFTAPTPSASELSLLYSTKYSYKDSMSQLTSASPRVRGQTRFIQEHVLNNPKFKFNPRPTLLEVGCAAGSLLAALSSASTEAICFEASPGLVDKVKANVRAAGARSVVVFRSIWNASLVQKNSVDLFITSHVVEHIPDVCVYFKQVFDVMKPGGAVFTEIPNHNLEYVKTSGDGMFHLFYPTPEGFMHLMRASGFVPVVEALIGSDDFLAVPEGFHIRSIHVKPPHPAMNYQAAQLGS